MARRKRKARLVAVKLEIVGPPYTSAVVRLPIGLIEEYLSKQLDGWDYISNSGKVGDFLSDAEMIHAAFTRYDRFRFVGL